MIQVKRTLTVLSLLAVGAAAACGGGAHAARYIAANNALVGVGYASAGPVRQGTLEKGKDARFRFEVEAGCFAWLVVGEGALSDLDVALLSGAGEAIAKSDGGSRDAVVKACVTAKGAYQVVIKGREAGDLLVAMYKGTAATPESASPVADGEGTCASPKVLSVGTASGSTAALSNTEQGTCGGNDSPEAVYRLDLTEKQHVAIELDPRFDSVLYVRRDACGESEFEVSCNDDAGPSTSRGGSNSISKIEGVWEPGHYFVFVDGNDGQSGAFRLTTTLASVPTLADACRGAKPLSLVQPTNGNSSKAFNLTSAACADGTKGPEIPYSLEIPVAARVRVEERASGFSPAVHLRRECERDDTEIACNDDALTDGAAVFTGALAAGRYFVFADSTDAEDGGAFSVEVETDVEPGTGVAGDACSSAVSLSAADQSIDTDTFTARDDFSGKCGGVGAPDVVYRFDLRKRMRVTANAQKSETKPLFSIASACGDKSKEIACGKSIDQILPAGTYFLIVDGEAAGQFGRSSVRLHLADVEKQEAACRNAPLLRAGQTVSATTAGAGDKFGASCAGATSSSDRQYKVILTERSKVHLDLQSSSFEGVLSLRKSCLDLAGGGTAEVACSRHRGNRNAQIDRTLDAGTYFVSIDGVGATSEGGFTLKYQVAK